jgi:hypothetical protein
VVLDQLGRQADGILRRDRAVGPHFQHQFFVVGHLPQTRGFHRIVHLAHRRMHRIHGNVADGQILVEVAVRANVAAAVLHAHLQLQLAALAHRGDVDALVQHREIGVFLDHGRGHDAGLLRVERDGLGLIGVQLQRHLLQIEDDVGGVLHHAGDGAELVQHALDLHGGNRGAFDGTQQGAPQEFPTVVPHPRSQGCAENLPYLSVSESNSAASRFGF